MRQDEKKLVVAMSYNQAKHYAQNIMGWKRIEWRWVASIDDLVGLRNIILFDVRSPRYKPTAVEAAKYEVLRNYIPIIQEAGRVAKINVYNLPT